MKALCLVLAMFTLTYLHGDPQTEKSGSVTGRLVPDSVISSGRGFILAGAFVPDSRHAAVLSGDGSYFRIGLPSAVSQLRFPDGRALSGFFSPDGITLHGDSYVLNGIFTPDDPSLSGFRLSTPRLKMPRISVPRGSLPKLAMPKLNVKMPYLNLGKAVSSGMKGITDSAVTVFTAPTDIAAGVASNFLGTASPLLQSTLGALGLGQQAQGQVQDQSAGYQQQAASGQDQQSAWVEDPQSGMYYNQQTGQWYDPQSGMVTDPQTGQWVQTQAAA